MNTRTITAAAPVDDMTLICGILNNRMSSFRLFQDRYLGYIKHLFGRWINDTSDAEELSYDVLAKTIAGIGRFDPDRGSLRMWIYAIAIHVRNDYLRKTAACRAAVTVVSLDDPVTSGSDTCRIDNLTDSSTDSSLQPSAAYTGDPGLQAAQAVIEALPIDTRYILQMHSDGYTSSEIAETVHKPEGTVRSICSRILKTIRNAYEKAMRHDMPATAADTTPGCDTIPEQHEPVSENTAIIACDQDSGDSIFIMLFPVTLTFKSILVEGYPPSLTSPRGAVFKRSRMMSSNSMIIHMV
ncbi:MAG: RNA polymerase sigma factor [Spirochaetes bacterium]|nr:RNA polymerase sigma factor [Spirochaetota bacterium]